MNTSVMPHITLAPFASPRPRVLPAGLVQGTLKREVYLKASAESVSDALVISALLAAVAETFMPAAFRCPILGLGEILVDARDLAHPRLLQNRIATLSGQPQPCFLDGEAPLVLGQLDPKATVSADWDHDDHGVLIRWQGRTPHLASEELDALTDSTRRWIEALSTADPCPAVQSQVEGFLDPVLGGRRYRLDLLHSLIVELGAASVSIDGDASGIGVTATLPPGLSPLQLRAAVGRRMVNQPFPVRWKLDEVGSVGQSPLLTDLLTSCRIVLGSDVGAEDDFFAHGGDSLSVMQVLRRLTESTGHHFDLGTVLHALRTRSLGHAAALLSKKASLQNTKTPQLDTFPEDRFAPFPLTAQQQAYVMGRGQNFQQGGLSCHTYQEFDGADVDPEKLRHLWNRLHRRHDMLRIRIDEATLTQQVLPPDSPAPFEVVDLRSMSTQQLSTALAQNTKEMSHRVAPLDGSLYLVRLLLLPEGRVRLCLSFDALITDLASLGVVCEELEQLWRFPDADLPEPGPLFRDYVLNDLNETESSAHQAAVEYWENKLSELPSAPQLPVPDTSEAGRFIPHAVRIPGSIWQQVRSHASNWGLTPSTVLTACYAEVLSQWAASQHFTLNVPRFNRKLVHPKVERTVGEFASIILVAVDRRNPQSFGAFARSLQEQIWADLSHQELPGIEILRRLRRHTGSDALMPTVLTSATFLNSDPTHLIGLERVLRLSQTPQVDIDCILEEAGDDLVINWDHRAGRIDTEIVTAMADTFTELLIRLTHAATWSELDPAPAVGLDPTRQGLDAELPAVHAHEPFFARAQEDPEATALLSSQGSIVTRGALATWALRLMAEWNLLTGPSDPVVILLDKSPEQIAAVFAVCASGRAYVPLDTSAPLTRLQQQIKATGAKAAVVSPAWSEKELGTDVRHLQVSQPPRNNEPFVGPSPAHGYPGATRCAVIFTSGSTGQPKGVEVTHEAIVNCVTETNHRLFSKPSDRFLAISALHHDMSMFDVFGVLGSGGQLVVPTDVDRRDADTIATLVSEHQITGWVSVPALAQMLVQRAASGQIASLRKVILGGDWVPPSLVHDLMEAAPGIRVVSVGGPTETTMWNIWHDVDPGHEAGTIPYGLPLKNTSYRIVDERMRARPLGVGGTLVCSGTGVSPGYVGGFKTSFGTHPVTGEWIYITGDMGIVHDAEGPIWFLGRGDRQLKVNGYRIEPAEIEQALLTQPQVKQAIVTGVERGNGLGHQAIIAHVVAADITAEELRDWLGEQLPSPLIPNIINVLDEFPLTPNGKIDRAALAKHVNTTEKADEPARPLEAVLAQLCCDELGLCGVDLHHDLFSLGADSLFAARLATRVDTELPGLQLAMRDVFLTPTIADIARAVADRAPEGAADRIASLWLRTTQLDDDQLAALVAERS